VLDAALLIHLDLISRLRAKMTPPPRHNGERIDLHEHDLFLLPPGFGPSDFSTVFVLAFPCRELVICRNARWTILRFFAGNSSPVVCLTLFSLVSCTHSTISVSTSYPTTAPVFCRHNTQQATWLTGNCPLSSSKLRSGLPYHSQFANRDTLATQTTRHPFTWIDATRVVPAPMEPGAMILEP